MPTQRNPWRWGRDYSQPPAATPPPPEPEPEVPEVSVGEPTEYPWDKLTTHAQIDNYMADEQIDWPEGWSAMTIALKKQWLDDRV